MPAPPRDRIVRGLFAEPVEFRSEQAADGTIGTMHGHFAVFNTWTEINSAFEGHFRERIAPGAFRKTFAESGPKIKVLYDHGHDPSVGNKILGIPTFLREDETGAAFEVPLHDTSYNRDLKPGLEAGAYGTSFKFQVMREDFVRTPRRTAENPKGISERTITEVKVAEFGPVTFPAYPEATVGMRSMTDDYLLGELMDDPERLTALLQSRGLAAVTPKAKPVYFSNVGGTSSTSSSAPTVTVTYGGNVVSTREERVDVSGVHTLACAADYVQQYLAEELQDGDDADAAKARTVIGLLEQLINSEAAEPADEEDSSPAMLGEYSADPAGTAHETESEPPEATTQRNEESESSETTTPEGEPQDAAQTRTSKPVAADPLYKLIEKEKESWRI